MEIWLDTCDPQMIAKGCRLGLCDGVTTNPSLLAAMKENPHTVIQRLLDIQTGPVAVQVNADEADDMVKEAMVLRSFSDRVIIKVPVIQEGLAAIQALVSEGIPVMATAIFQPNQALLAAITGADYVAPYVCRMFDEGIDAYVALETMASIYKQHLFKTKILAAALRTPDQITICATLGLSAVTLKHSLFEELIADDQATCRALRSFSEDWQRHQHYALTH
jgi:TalC/MipB family fructose-6-phosphate aldolase